MQGHLTFYITVVSMFLWIFPMARQYKSELFFYFLVLGLTDPIIIISYKLIPGFSIRLVLGLLLLLSVMYSTNGKKSLIKFTFFSFLIITIDLLNPFKMSTFISIIINSVIIYFFFKRAVIFSASDKKLNLFHVILLLEAISTVLKAIFVLFYNVQAFPFFYITSIFEYLFALFFSFYREDDERVQIRLRDR